MYFPYKLKFLEDIMTKFVLFGANGMLGRYIWTYFEKLYEVIPVTRVDIDASSITEEQLLEFLEGIGEISVIFNAVGLIPSAPKADYYKINGEWPIKLARVAKRIGAKMFHPTTDCVYDGLGDGFYLEEDPANEINDYGRSKAIGDDAECMIIRTSIIGEELTNKRSLVEWVRSNSGKTIKGYTNHHWNGITCLQYAKIIHYLLEANITWEGVRHIYSPVPYTKKEIVEMINDTYNLGIRIEEYETEIKCNKTLASSYSLSSELEIPDLREQIIEIHDYKLICK